MNFTSQRLESNKIVVQLEGLLNRWSVPKVRRRILALAGQEQVAVMEIDLSRVAKLDTAGIALMVEVLRTLAGKGGKLRLTGLNENAVKMIRLSRLDSAFDMEHATSGGS